MNSNHNLKYDEDNEKQADDQQADDHHRLINKHLADSNRYAPGMGHTNFDDIFSHLRGARYDGWLSVEILPKPDPQTAARRAAEYLAPYIQGVKP